MPWRPARSPQASLGEGSEQQRLQPIESSVRPNGEQERGAEGAAPVAEGGGAAEAGATAKQRRRGGRAIEAADARKGCHAARLAVSEG